MLVFMKLNPLKPTLAIYGIKDIKNSGFSGICL